MICGHSSPISTAPRCKRSEGVRLASAGSAQLCGISCSYRVSVVLLAMVPLTQSIKPASWGVLDQAAYDEPTGRKLHLVLAELGALPLVRV